MSSYYSSQPSGPLEVEIKICSAQDLKNVSWKHGPLKPYAVVWVDPKAKCTTKVDEYGDTCPKWDEILTIPLPPPPPYSSSPLSISDSTYLFIDIVHLRSSDEDTKPLIGSVRVPLKEIIDEVGMGEWAHRKLHLKRPSGRPHGKLEVEIKVRENRYRAPDPYYAPPYGVPPPPASAPPYSSSAGRDYSPSGSYPYSSGGAAPPSGYPYDPQPYGQNPAYGQPSYGQPAYGGEYGGMPAKKDSKFGMGTGLAVGAVAGVLGGLAISEGIDHLEDSIADDVTERVEDDLGYDDDDY
ncbi:hypothetical protein MKW98_010358 [Papaver atlanticum]|uniref:C2 domain-containing protein n=1 Tax=Papaver atlanticum TaxID=357466 RepID=A0AAD4SN83_9MAGN|nr:hypothetical protein MKW98_010358 [Papaver atlanticum]